MTYGFASKNGMRCSLLGASICVCQALKQQVVALEVGSTIFRTMLARLKTQQMILCPMSNLHPFMFKYDGELALQPV